MHKTITIDKTTTYGAAYNNYQCSACAVAGIRGDYKFCPYCGVGVLWEESPKKLIEGEHYFIGVVGRTVTLDVHLYPYYTDMYVEIPHTGEMWEIHNAPKYPLFLNCTTHEEAVLAMENIRVKLEGK